MWLAMWQARVCGTVTLTITIVMAASIDTTAAVGTMTVGLGVETEGGGVYLMLNFRAICLHQTATATTTGWIRITSDGVVRDRSQGPHQQARASPTMKMKKP